MRRNIAAESGVSRHDETRPLSDRDNAQRVLAVLAVEPQVSALSLGRIKALGERVPGVAAVRVDAPRGRIHVLYNGTAATIEQVEDAVRIPGHTLRLLGNSPPLPEGGPDDH